MVCLKIGIHLKTSQNNISIGKMTINHGIEGYPVPNLQTRSHMSHGYNQSNKVPHPALHQEAVSWLPTNPERPPIHSHHHPERFASTSPGHLRWPKCGDRRCHRWSTSNRRWRQNPSPRLSDPGEAMVCWGRTKRNMGGSMGNPQNGWCMENSKIKWMITKVGRG